MEQQFSQLKNKLALYYTMSLKKEKFETWYGTEVDVLRRAGGLEWDDVEVILKDQPAQYHEEILRQFVRTIPPKQRKLQQS